MSHNPTESTGSSTDLLAQEPIVTGRARTRLNLTWAVSLFGTAVGAGILFLPINAGAGGPWPLLLVTLLVGPMTYLSHRGLSRFVCVSPRQGEDITVVAGDYFGRGWGIAITILYFFAIYPIVLVYGVGITNTVDSFIVNQLGGPEIPRYILAPVLIGLLMLVMIFGEKVMLVFSNILVYPLIAALAFLTFYMIPMWDTSIFTNSVPDASSFLLSAWVIIPVLVFAFNHSPAISQFSLAMKRNYGRDAVQQASNTLRITTVMLVIFTMAFVWSSVLALGTEGLAEARAQNVPVLSYLANIADAPLITWMGPLIAMAAIGSSFFGHYLGTAEGAMGMIRDIVPGGHKISPSTTTKIVAVFVYVTSVITAIINPNILTIIEAFSGPVIAAILYLMPVIAIYVVPALEPYRKRWFTNVFVLVMGTIAIARVFVDLVELMKTWS